MQQQETAGAPIERLAKHVAYLEGLLQSNNIPFRKLEELPKQSTARMMTHHQKPNSQQLQTNLRPDVLPRHLIERYSRQMLLKEIQLTGQIKLTKAKVAIIGCGGIGCPLAMYLASAGVGTIGLFDSDRVEVTNLHRQIGHPQSRLGQEKTASLEKTLLGLNPYVNIQTHPYVDVDTLDELDEYDLVLDGSDNPKCRYLVNDYCQRVQKPLLSGACIGWEGQVTSYGGNAACYRCIWGNDEVSAGGCSTRGVVGMLPGLVALIVGVEALKLLVLGRTDLQGHLVLYDGLSCSFRKVKLRQKNPACIACGTNRMKIEQYDYAKYAGSCVKPPPETPTVPWEEYMVKKGFLLDVRSEAMFNIVRIEPSFNIPYDRLKGLQDVQLKQLLAAGGINPLSDTIYVSCRRGNDSRRAVEHLLKNGFQAINVKGGIEQYGRLYDSNIPNI